MSGTSEYGGLIARPAYPASYAPIDPVVGRDYGCNNANHAADVNAQVRFNWCGPGFIDSVNSADGTWQPMFHAAPFPISLMPSGAGYNLRVRIAGTRAATGAKVAFALTLGTSWPTDYPGTATGDDLWVSDEIDTDTPAWVTGSSQGPNLWANMISVPAARASAASRYTATISDVAGDPSSAVQAMIRPVVWAYVDVTSVQCRLYGLSIEEWVAG